MAKKFYDLEETAELLGITPDRLNEMRSSNEIRGFRDGSTWKFKFDEIQRVQDVLKSGDGGSQIDVGESGISLASDIGVGDEKNSEEEGSVLLSERELGDSGLPATSSTVIGKSPTDSGVDSDIELATDESPAPPADSPVTDVKLEGASEVLASGASDLGLQMDELDSLELDFEDESPSDKTSGSDVSSDISLEGDSDLSLGDDDSGVGSGVGSSIDLGEDDDDLVLGGSGSGSDITGSAGDSGISLMDPADSGLSLEEEPLDLGGSSLSSESLVLGEDEMITLGDDTADVSAATQLKGDDFELTPLADAIDDESESGSQVIALDSEELGADQEAATMLGAGAGGGAMAMLEEDLTDAETMVGGPGMAPMGPGAGLAAPQPMGMTMTAPVLPEAPYSVWNVLSLFVCIVILCLCGMMMYDLVRNIWSWDEAYTVNTGMMDGILEWFKE